MEQLIIILMVLILTTVNMEMVTFHISQLLVVGTNYFTRVQV